MSDYLDQCMDDLALVIDNDPTDGCSKPSDIVERDALMWALRGCIEHHGLDPSHREVYGTMFALAVALQAIAANPTATLQALGPVFAYAADQFRRRSVDLGNLEV